MTTTLTAKNIDDTITVTDAEGGVWFPTPEAAAEINASANPEAAAIRICAEEPMRGTWRQ